MSLGKSTNVTCLCGCVVVVMCTHNAKNEDHKLALDHIYQAAMLRMKIFKY